MAYPVIKYPSKITPHGEYHILKGVIPDVVLTAHDGSIEFYLMGGRSITDHLDPESVRIKDIKGLVPQWQTIDQKGATQDGTTFVTALYDPIEMDFVVEARGRAPQWTRKVVRDLYASLDPIKTSTLAFYTHENGRWWTNIRWAQPPDDPIERIMTPRQQITLRLRSDESFWRSYDSNDMFRLSFESMVEQFSTASANTAGPNLPIYRYAGTGGGYPKIANGHLSWVDDPARPTNSLGVSVMLGPYKDFVTATNNQVVKIKIGSFQEMGLTDGAENHLWARCSKNADGTWNGTGIRAVLAPFAVKLSRFNGFTETPWRTLPIFPPPMPGEDFSLIAGFPGEERRFQIQRNGLPILDFTENGTASALGASNRGVGLGMRAGAALLTQVTPSMVDRFTAGDNASVGQSGYLRRVNVGDQPMYDDYTVFGPGTFKIWNGPEAQVDDFVEFGPLLTNQVMLLRTHPGKRTLHNLTVIPPSPQELTSFQHALNQFLTFAFANNVPPLAQAIASRFGILPPQGNPYSLLDGRWSERAAIPPKSPGKPVQEYTVKVEIKGGNADSKIISSGTPLRRYPL